MQTSERGIALIKKHEGLRLTAYLCPAGVWTIGYGHTTNPRVLPGMCITEEEAQRLLIEDLRRFERAVYGSVTAPINQNQFDAFVSLAFNIGAGAFRSSTALKRHNAGEEPSQVADAILWWKKGGGKVLQGLVKRRADEAALYMEEV